MSGQPNTYALIFVAFYLLSLLVIGYFAQRKSTTQSLQDFYLANNSLGFFVLIFTLFATQYSAISIVGYTGAGYYYGFSWLVAVPFMMSVVIGYLLIAPKLFLLSRRYSFVTPGDFLRYRYQSPWLSCLISVLMVFMLSIYIVAQLMAIGYTVETFLFSDNRYAYPAAVIGLALIILIYEWMGGMRAVAWSDMIQGIIMLVAFLLLAVLVSHQFDGLEAAVKQLIANGESYKVLPPSREMQLTWLSYFILIIVGVPLYPQAIQRIYAAKSDRVLRKSFMVMLYLPFITVLVVILLGIFAAAYYPNIAHQDQVLAILMKSIMQSSLLGTLCVVVLFAAILAAIMSTVDSALLSISSIMSKDIASVLFARDYNSQQLTYLGKFSSLFLIVAYVVAAIVFRDSKLIDLLNFKLDLMVQFSPAFMLGLHWVKLRAKAVIWGLLVGTVIIVGLNLLFKSHIYGVSVGLIGLMVNIIIATMGSLNWRTAH